MSPKAEGLATADFDYTLPPDRIADRPTDRREGSRLLVVDRRRGTTEHRVFSDVAGYMRAGDALILNETRVFPARLRGRRPSGAPAEVLLLHPLAAESTDADAGLWRALVRPGAKLRPGTTVEIATDLAVTIEGVAEDGARTVRLASAGPVRAAIERYGEVPLPPYIERAPEPADRERYQTVFAREEGSVAAPTAGLHFSEPLLAAIRERGVMVGTVVLHVGIGTFRPVEVEDPADHRMHAERYSLPEHTARLIDDTRAAGGAVWAVGTTVTRTLESCVGEDGRLRPGAGWTSLFIRPPWTFRAVDRLITNFHLPRSTLLMLVSAFGGHELVMRAYRDAVQRGYRFYSYGDAMVLL